jgi:hypothetical protein
MTRLVLSVFAVAFAASFAACEQHSVAALPPHYQHKMHHGDVKHPPGDKGEVTKDPNLEQKKPTGQAQ